MKNYATDNIFDVYAPEAVIAGCGDCICQKCCRKDSGSCPYGECYDDYRSLMNPRTDRLGAAAERHGRPYYDEVKHRWCIFGVFFPAEQCAEFIPKDGTYITQCLTTLVTHYPDGVQFCPIVNSVGCQFCYERFDKENDV